MTFDPASITGWAVPIGTILTTVIAAWKGVEKRRFDDLTDENLAAEKRIDRLQSDLDAQQQWCLMLRRHIAVLEREIIVSGGSPPDPPAKPSKTNPAD